MSALFITRPRGKLFVLSAPAGTGKTTLIKKLTGEFKEVQQNISYTSRKARPNEQNGVDYHFISTAEFQDKLQAGDFLEYAKVYDDYYGTDKKDVEECLSKGKHLFLVIDTQGAIELKKKCPAVFIFVSPPSFDELKRRLITRKTEEETMIEERLEWSRKEIEVGRQYEYQIMNDNLEIAYQILKSIVIAEDHKS